MSTTLMNRDDKNKNNQSVNKQIKSKTNNCAPPEKSRQLLFLFVFFVKIYFVANTHISLHPLSKRIFAVTFDIL